MTRLHRDERDPVVDDALDAMNEAQLRELIRALIPSLDGTTQTHVMNEVVDRAARSSNGWAPPAPTEQKVEEIEAFAAMSRRIHQADPEKVDDYLREGTHAFLSRDYTAAFRIFQVLLLPIGAGEVDLGQREVITEVLGVDVDACAKQYVVAMYMTSSTRSRARAVCSSIKAVQSVGYFPNPLRELERVAVEPLPDFDDFLVQWRALVEELVASASTSNWDREEDRWLREVVARTQGSEGLADIARGSGRRDDLRAWCNAYVNAGDWSAARDAYEEAAELVEDRASFRGEFLDGVSLAAQELGADDLDDVLERAWREAPSLTRLRCWLGGCTTREELVARAGAALEVAPADAARQRALLHILRAEFDAAATLLANAPGLGWSSSDHPGHLVFPVFVTLLGGIRGIVRLLHSSPDISYLMDDDRPKLRTPTTDALLRLAGVTPPKDNETRSFMIATMRIATEKRMEGVTANKRRRHYDHAASLAIQCALAEGSLGGQTWLHRLMNDYRRYPALQRAFNMASS